jgi:hypothetical protein
MHNNILAYVRARLLEARAAPPSPFRDGACEELEELISYIEEEAFVEDWDDDEDRL